MPSTGSRRSCEHDRPTRQNHLARLLDLDPAEIVEYTLDHPGKVTVTLRRLWQSSDIPAEACDILGIPHRPSLTAITNTVNKILNLDDSDRSPEDAHIAQDRLYEDVLRCVAEDHPNAADMVAQALLVADSKGTRWYE